MLRWLAFSVIIPLGPTLGLAGSMQWYLGKPLLQQRLVDGSLLLFSIVLVASTFGYTHREIAANFAEWASTTTFLFFLGIIFFSVLLYVLILTGIQPADPGSIPRATVTMVLSSVIYGVICRFYVPK